MFWKLANDNISFMTSHSDNTGFGFFESKLITAL